ncbi:unnamed protein product [Brassica oleracea var. botrytis]|uniref:(rape) hypothetical protein n=1 Tax=Brassica napus TaxID=3708 RepID=A0A816RXK7_BRANA|nr:unnamed protein product [Brassica napus]
MKSNGRDVVARLVKTLGANCHASGFDARRRKTAHLVIKCGTGCWALSPAQVNNMPIAGYGRFRKLHAK